jgi:hypothetical protein
MRAPHGQIDPAKLANQSDEASTTSGLCGPMNGQ